MAKTKELKKRCGVKRESVSSALETRLPYERLSFQRLHIRFKRGVTVDYTTHTTPHMHSLSSQPQVHVHHLRRHERHDDGQHKRLRGVEHVAGDALGVAVAGSGAQIQLEAHPVPPSA